MGIDVGFDLYPPLPKSDDSQDAWSSFFFAVRDEFQDDHNVGMKDGSLIFEVGEYPSLPFDGTRFRRFSSKVTGRCESAEFYIKQVARIAKCYFKDRVFFWSEYGDFPNIKYSWTEVHGVTAGGKKEKDIIPFHVVATAVVSAFENVHQGMDGLWLIEALFPENDGYRIVQEMRGFGQVNRVEDWTEFVQGYSEVRAYWAARTHNNCATLNGTLLKVLKVLEGKGISKISVTKTSGFSFKEEVVMISTTTKRKIGLSPHHVGTIVEPPCVSRVPPSPDGETFHEFLVGMTEDKGIPMALDCSAAQYGLSDYFPFASDDLVSFLRKLGTHRLLKISEGQEAGIGSSFVNAKVEACTCWALKALAYWCE